ncbi:MAG: DUF1292 domain-containing protein [Lachnospiraceae bacterium]|nr:DUF1292 domain-containing protein [Lachnospiraceae bacterium]
MDKIFFVPEGEEEEVSFYILDQAQLAGVSYLLVTDTDPQAEEDADAAEGVAYVMKDMAASDASDSVYEFVEDDAELSAVCALFKDTLDEMGIELEE